MSRKGQALVAALSRELGINAKTAARSRKPETFEDLTTDPKEPHSTLLTKPSHLWSCEDYKAVLGTVFPSGRQVEQMNRTIKEAAVKRVHRDGHVQLNIHLGDFIAAYNFNRRCKTPSGLIF
jgi:hypothetical protein